MMHLLGLRPEPDLPSAGPVALIIKQHALIYYFEFVIQLIDDKIILILTKLAKITSYFS